MPTEAVSKSIVLESIDELIFKLVGPRTILFRAHELILDYRERLEQVARHMPGGEVLAELLAFDAKFRKLPESWEQFTEFVQGREKNVAPLAQILELRAYDPEAIQFVFTDLEMLMSKVWEKSEANRISNICKAAHKIATGGMTIKDQKYKGPEDAQRWLLNQLNSVGDIAVELEPGQIELLAGHDGASTFTLTGTLASEVNPAPTIWLWENKIPLGQMTLIAGKPGGGKSTVALDIIARVTMGADWPDGAKNTLGPRKVVLAAAEDDRSTTIVPRLMAAGANLEKIIFLDPLTVRDYSAEDSTPQTRQLQLSEDVGKLRQLLADEPDIVLVVVDTITSYFGEVNTNLDKGVRPVMDALAKAFRDCTACFLGIVHLNKRSDTDALGKILGASSIAGAVRAVWNVNKDPDNKEERFFTEVKNNLAKSQSGIKFTTKDKEVSAGIKGSYVEWLASCEETADDVMNKERDTQGRKDKKGVDLARVFLPAALAKGSRLARELFKEAEAEGISVDQLKRAKYELGIITFKKQDGWYWQRHVDTEKCISEEIM